jgi:hypothetical protein
MIRPNTKHSTGTFSECAHYGIPYCLQIISTLKVVFNSVSQCINIYIYKTPVSMIWYIFNYNWVATRWHSYSTHIHTNNTQNDTKKQYIEQHKKYIQHKNLEECGPCPVFAVFTLAFASQLRKKHGKTSVRVAIHKHTIRIHNDNNKNT